MSLVRLGDNFGEVVYALAINGAFDVTTPLQAWQLEAGARGKCVIIQVTLVDPEIYFGPNPDEEGNPSNDEPSD